jgi:NAD(P)-dependent dehydrogenase (short-subunit alcohol dehydrogenase family)
MLQTHKSISQLSLGGRKGIGKVITESFLAEGANVSYCSRNVTGEEFATFKGATGGARAVGTSVDIADPDSIKDWVENAAETFGRIDIVVANGELDCEPSILSVGLTCL